MSLIGTLDEIKLADVLRLFASGRKTGVLKASTGERQALLNLRDGHVVHAESGRLLGEEAVFDLFGWQEGQLTFVPVEQPVAPNVDRDIESLIEEAQRVGASFHRRRNLIPSDRMCFQMGPPPAAPDARVAVGPTEWAVLRCLDGLRDVRELVEATGLSRESVLDVLCALLDAGFLERVEPSRALRVQSQGVFGKDEAGLDERVEQEWLKLARFGDGILRIEVRSRTGRRQTLPVSFRQGLFRDVHLPRAVLTSLGVREGDDVTVRPVA